MTDLITEVKGVERKQDGTVVTVDVTGPEIAPEFTKELRARARALVSVGPVGTTIDTVTDVTTGQINRLTEVMKGPIKTSDKPDVIPKGDFIERQLETIQYDIKVNRHGGGDQENIY